MQPTELVKGLIALRRFETEATELAEGWALSTLVEICQVNPRKPAPDALSTDMLVTFVPMPAVEADAGTIIAPGEKMFAKARKGSYTPFQENDVLFAKITPCMENGKAAIARGLSNGLGFGSTEFHVFRPSAAVLPEYIYYFIRQESFRGEAKTHMAGNVGQQRVPVDFVKKAEIPLPPLAEQKRIVAKVEDLLARVNAAKERLAKLPGILKRFRQSILASACSGKLTENWRDGNGEATDRYTGSLPGVELPANWNTAKIKELACKVGSGATPRGGRSSYKTSGVPLIRSQNVHCEGFTEKGLAFIDEFQAQSLDNVKVHEGDVLLNITGASIGRVTQAPKQMNGARVNQHVCIIRPHRLVTPAFLSIFLASPAMQDFIMKTQYGVTRQALTKGQILDFDIPIPPRTEQEVIIRRMEQFLALAKKVEERIAAATKRAEKLTQSILAKAFRGELVPTEAELADREGRDYESATELLARIRAEREQQPVETRRASKRKSSRKIRPIQNTK